jgi:hypothetical protein
MTNTSYLHAQNIWVKVNHLTRGTYIRILEPSDVVDGVSIWTPKTFLKWLVDNDYDVQAVHDISELGIRLMPMVYNSVRLPFWAIELIPPSTIEVMNHTTDTKFYIERYSLIHIIGRFINHVLSIY